MARSGAVLEEPADSPGVDGGAAMDPIRGVDAARAPLMASDNGACPAGYGTIYKYDGTTECADPMQPNIADVIAAEAGPGPVDRMTIGIADTLKTGVDAARGAVGDLAALANPFGSWGAALLWLAVGSVGLYALSGLRR